MIVTNKQTFFLPIEVAAVLRLFFFFLPLSISVGLVASVGC
jgi:hypothetical protein